MNLLARALKHINSTPAVFLQPTRVKSFDVPINLLHFAFWTFIAKRSKHTQLWYRESSANPTYGSPATDFQASDLLRDGVVIIKDFLNTSALYDVQRELSSTDMPDITPRRYGSGVLAYYSHLSAETIEHFEARIKDIFFSIWGYAYSGPLAASVQKLRLPRGQLDSADSNTELHIDRFLPAVKIFYFPYEVKDNEAPFGYVLGTQMIDSRYQNCVKDSFRILSGKINRPFELPHHPYKNEYRIALPANSLVVAATHGLHRRVPFEGVLDVDRSRVSIRFIFYNQLTKTKLITSSLIT
jgi:hypothetical protein